MNRRTGTIDRAARAHSGDGRAHAYIVSITVGLLGAVALLAATGLAPRDHPDHPRLVAASRLLVVLFVATTGDGFASGLGSLPCRNRRRRKKRRALTDVRGCGL